MAITLANQSASVLGTAANSWNYTLGFTPTVGNKLVFYVLTPVSAGATAGPWALSHGSTTMACVGTRTGATGSYNVNMFIGDATTTSTTVSMFFTTTSLHGIIAAEFTGWTNISPLATLTSTTTFTSGVAFSNVPVRGGRDFVTTGTNATGVRSLSLAVNASFNVSLSSFDETSMSGTPSGSVSGALADYTWFFAATSNVSGTGTGVTWTTRNWTGGPSGGNQLALAAATGSSLTGITVGSGPAWTQLTNPAGISTSILRCFYKSGTSLNNISNTTTSSASSAMTTLGQIFGEKSLVTTNVSSTDSYRPAGIQVSKAAFGDSQGLTDANAGISYFWTGSTGTVPKVGNYAGFTSGSTTLWRTITGVAFVPTYSTYYITLDATIPQIGSTTTYSTFTLADSLVSSNATYPRIPSDTLGISETLVATRSNTQSLPDSLSFNVLLTGGDQDLEMISLNASVVKDYKVVYDQFDTATGAPDGAAILGESSFYFYSATPPNWNDSDQVIFWNGQTGEFTGPLYVSSVVGPLPYTGGTSNVYRFYTYGEVGNGQQGAIEYDSVILLDTTATIHDFFNMFAVYPYVDTYVDPTTGQSNPFQGGFF